MKIFNFFHKKKMGENHNQCTQCKKTSKTSENQFQCTQCKKILDKRHLHSNQMCVDCFSKTYIPVLYSKEEITPKKKKDECFNSENKKTSEHTECSGSAYKFNWNTIIGPKDENLKKDFNPNIRKFEEPIYFANGIMSENEIHLGTYWLNSGDYEQVTVKKADDAWYVCSVAMWPVHRGASNGGYIETKLDEEFLNLKKIKNTGDFLNEFLRGNTKSCIELVKKDEQTLELIDRICKPLYCM